MVTFATPLHMQPNYEGIKRLEWPQLLRQTATTLFVSLLFTYPAFVGKLHAHHTFASTHGQPDLHPVVASALEPPNGPNGASNDLLGKGPRLASIPWL